MIRLALVAILGLASVSGGKSRAEERRPAETVTEIARTTKTATGQPIALPQGPTQVVASIYSLVPGARLPEHKHPFQRYAYVLEGELRVQQADASSRVYRAGDFIVESVDGWHFGAAAETGPVKLLVIDQAPPGAEVTIDRR
ncbi:cupin domain-containing protein [Methylocystis sp.]|uniref:cupin domain-containing protein n=1 Tax=Methylocystis sp. TaxID=1911079 RepID=UPI003D0BB13B